MLIESAFTFSISVVKILINFDFPQFSSILLLKFDCKFYNNHVKSQKKQIQRNSS